MKEASKPYPSFYAGHPGSLFLALLSLLILFFTIPVHATITTVASEESGTTIGVIEHVGAGTAGSRNNNCGSISPTVPTGNVGDLLIAVAVIRENTTNVTMAGWNLYYSGYHGVDGNQDVGGYIFWRVATDAGGGGSADASNIVSTSTGAPANCRSLRGQISRFDGVDVSAMPGSAFEVNPIAAGNSSTQNTANVTTGTNTTTVATAMSIAVTFINDNATVTEGDGFSESFDFTSSGGRDSSMSLNYRQELSTGTKGAFTWPQNLGTDESIGVLFALKPDNSIEGLGVNVPSGTSTDDVMVAAIAVGPSTTGITAPAGWTLINRVDQATATSNSQAVYYRVATATEPSAYVWTFSGGTINGAAGGIVTYNGVDTTSPIDASGGNTTASSTTHQANSINTTVANTMIVATHSFSSSETWTPPAGMTEQVDVASAAFTPPNANGISLEMSDVIQAAIGATGNKTATAAGNADTGVGQLIALTPLVIVENITVTFTGGPADRVVAGSISITDAALGTPELSATNTNGAASAAITTNIGPTLTTNALLIDIVGKPHGNRAYTAGAGQTERLDRETGNFNNGVTGAMSTKQVSSASDSMLQTHSAATRQNAQAVVSVAPATATSTATYDAAASRTRNNTNGFSWNHTFTTTNFVNGKLVVGVAYRDAAACGTVSISGLTIGGMPFIQITSTSVTDIATGACQYVDLWYVDLNNIILSTNNNSNLGGQAIDQDEAVEYEGFSDTGSLFIDDAIFAANERLDAIHYLDNGNVAISISSNNGASVGGTAFEEDDIVEVTTSGTFVQELFSEDNFTSAEDNARDIDSVYIRDNGDIVLSTAGTETLPACGGGSLTVTDDDIVEWDVSMSCATFVVAFAPLLSGGGDEDIVGLHYLNDDPNMMLISLLNNQTLDSQAFTDGDVILYDRNTSTAYLYMDESNFTADEDIDALTLTINPVTTPTLQNFVITVSATASTCTSTEVTIEARDTTNSIFNYDGTITLSTSVTASATSPNGTWDEVDHNSMLSVSNPATNTVNDPTADDGSATYLFDTSDGGRVGLFLFNQHAETLTVTVEDTSVAGSATVSGNITFSDNVFEITPLTCTGGTCPGTGSYEVVAGRDHSFQVDMVRNDGTSCGLASGYNSAAQSLKGWIVRDGDDPTGTLPTLAEGTLNDGSVPGANNVTLNFSTVPTGRATLTLQTTDVGKFELFLRDDSNSFAAVDIDGSTGSSNPITVRPFGIGFTNITGLVANPEGSTPGDTRFATAGSNYSANVGGYQYDALDDTDSDGVPDTNRDVADNGNSLTASYEWDTAVIAVLNTPTSGQGGVLGTFSFSTPNGGANLIGQADFSGGQEAVTDFAYFEVGSIRMQADATNFLNSTGVNVTGTSDVVGRFGADQFTFVETTSPVLGPACSGTFTYVDQGFNYSTAPQITARATAADGSTVLSNYEDFTGSGGDNWWLLNFNTGVNPAYTDLATPTDITLDTLASTYSPNTGVTGTNGSQLFNFTGPFSYAKNTPPISVQAPFNGSLRLDFTVTDSDSATGTHIINPITFNNSQQRWGRLNIGTSVGSELLPVAVSFTAEYFDGTGFITNTADGCTAIAETDLSLDSAVEAGQVDGDIDITNAGTCGGTGIATATMGNNPFSAGSGDLSFSVAAPASGCTGYVEIDIDLSALSISWLQYDWDDSDDSEDGPFDDNPDGRIDFGLFEGPSNYIYIREPW